MEGKLCDVADGKMEKRDLKVFWRSPSQCIYSMVLGFFDPWFFIIHGIYLWFFDPFSFLGVFDPFWREWG